MVADIPSARHGFRSGPATQFHPAGANRNAPACHYSRSSLKNSAAGIQGIEESPHLSRPAVAVR